MFRSLISHSSKQMFFDIFLLSLLSLCFRSYLHPPPPPPAPSPSMKIEGGCPTRIPLVYALNIYKPGGKMKTKADQIHIRLKSGKQHGKQGNRFILGGLATLLQDAWLAWAWLLLVPEKKYIVQNYTFWTFSTIKFHLGISNSYTSDMYIEYRNISRRRIYRIRKIDA